MIQQKLADEISLNFPKKFIIAKYVKIRFKNRGSPYYFLSSRRQKIKNITKTKQKIVFVYIIGFMFYGVSQSKTDLLNKYMI